MNIFKFHFLFLTLLTSLIVPGSALYAVVETQETKADIKFESNWYVLISAGAGNSVHDSVDMNAIAAKKSLGGTSRLTATADIPGIYRKISPQEVLGFNLRINMENIAESWTATEALVFHNYNYNLSYLRFWQNKIGQGPFYRLDLGYSELWRLDKSAGVYTNSKFTGTHGQAALGYGWQLPGGYHFLVALDQYYSGVGPHFISGNSIYVAFML